VRLTASTSTPTARSAPAATINVLAAGAPAVRTPSRSPAGRSPSIRSASVAMAQEKTTRWRRSRLTYDEWRTRPARSATPRQAALAQARRRLVRSGPIEANQNGRDAPRGRQQQQIRNHLTASRRPAGSGVCGPIVNARAGPRAAGPRGTGGEVCKTQMSIERRRTPRPIGRARSSCLVSALRCAGSVLAMARAKSEAGPWYIAPGTASAVPDDQYRESQRSADPAGLSRRLSGFRVIRSDTRLE
jgi:hypothetical protein